ncbi:hypothetical protein DRJ17_06035 [Candidatus Woesearchaeota archaeon]|nr:MAG: hypothetical protein DRJ17_06035 [Candidatus Woesearchaeota archaeon]
MKKEDILEKYLPKGIPKTEVDKIFKELQTERIGSMKAVVEDIEDLINKRERLNKEIFMDIEKIESGLNNFILQLGENLTPKEQFDLKKKQIEIEQLKIQEKLNAWRDIADLKHELRERLQEFREKETRATMLDKLLE